jgi:predicted naringenin-chalcone synthase
VVDPEMALAMLSRFWPYIGRLDDARAGLGRRYTCEPADALIRERSLTDQAASYRRHAPRLACAAAGKALGRAGLRGCDVDMIVTVSCTGYLVPALDVYLAPVLGLRPDVVRLPITELGCSAGATAIALAHRQLLGSPDQAILVIAVELPTLSFHAGDRSTDNLVSSLIFSDGAGAAVMTGGPAGAGLRVEDTASRLAPGTAHLLGFDLRDDGFHPVLDRRLARALARELPPAVESFRTAHGLNSLDFLAVHAGGPRILDAVQTALGLDSRLLDLSRQVFAEVGNTSSASIFFALDRLLGDLQGQAAAQGLGIGLGPGLTIELMHLNWRGSEDPGDEARPAGERLPIAG